MKFYVQDAGYSVMAWSSECWLAQAPGRGWDGRTLLDTQTQNKRSEILLGSSCGYYLANTQVFLAFQKFNLYHFAFKKDHIRTWFH